MNTSNPFSKSRERRFDKRLEFDGFKKKAEAEAKKACSAIERFKGLENYCSFYVFNDDPNTVQLNFGNRLMGRKDLDGKTAFENGLTLLYSIGPTGDVLVAMYPFKSTLARVHEDSIVLAIGPMTEYALISRLKGDLSDLVAYGHVSSIDADETWYEKWRIYYLRKFRPKYVDGKFVEATKKTKLVTPIIGWVTGILVRSFVTSLLKPVSILIILAITTYFGWSWLPELKEMLK